MLMDMLPELKDATDMVDVFAYYLGFSSKKPQFKRFNYAEKMEYWALVWGTFVMAAHRSDDLVQGQNYHPCSPLVD